MPITRYAKIVIALSLAVFCLLVVFNNLTDYGTNFLFVKHVLSMDTTYPGNALTYRSVTSPALWHFGYWLIIAGELIVGVLLLAGPSGSGRSGSPRARCSTRPRVWSWPACSVRFSSGFSASW